MEENKHLVIWSSNTIIFFLELSKMILSIHRLFYLKHRLRKEKNFELVLNLHLTCSLFCPERSIECLLLSLHERWLKTCVLQVSFGKLQHLGISVLCKFSINMQTIYKLFRREIGFKKKKLSHGNLLDRKKNKTLQFSR